MGSKASRAFGRAAGFSLIEVIAVVVILGVLATIGANALVFELHRDRAYAAANDLAGWLEAVRRSSERGRGCTVTITPSANATGATQIATAAQTAGSAINDPSQCRANEPLQFTSNDAGARYQVAVDPVATFVFTPRGTIFNPAAANGAFANTIQISVNTVAGGNAVAPMRCVRITPPLGAIEVINGNGTAGRCTP